MVFLQAMRRSGRKRQTRLLFGREAEREVDVAGGADGAGSEVGAGAEAGAGDGGGDENGKGARKLKGVRIVRGGAGMAD